MSSIYLHSAGSMWGKTSEAFLLRTPRRNSSHCQLSSKANTLKKPITFTSLWFPPARVPWYATKWDWMFVVWYLKIWCNIISGFTLKFQCKYALSVHFTTFTCSRNKQSTELGVKTWELGSQLPCVHVHVCVRTYARVCGRLRSWKVAYLQQAQLSVETAVPLPDGDKFLLWLMGKLIHPPPLWRFGRRVGGRGMDAGLLKLWGWWPFVFSEEHKQLLFTAAYLYY